MRGSELIREKVAKIAILMVVSAIVTALYFKNLGYKDSAMLFLASVSLITSIYLIFTDVEKSILIFITSFPVLVTARKAINIDFLFLKITYESIYITILFIFSFKRIVKMIKDYYAKEKGLNLTFCVFSGMFALFALNSALFSKTPMLSLSHTFVSVIVPIMFGLALLSNFIGKDIKRIYYSLILMCDFSCLYGFFQVVSNGISFSSISAQRHFITFGFHNVNLFAGIAILVLPLMLDIFLYGKKNKYETFFILVSIFLNTIAIFITYTRGAWIALLVSGVIVLISRRYKYFLYGISGLLIIGIRPIATYILRRGTSNTFFANESAIARVQSIFTSLFIMKRFPFGAGSGSYSEMYKKYAVDGYKMMPEWFRKKINVASYNMEAAHNLLLQIGTELGMVSMLSFIGIIFNRLVTAIRNFKDCRGETAAVVSYIIYALLTGIEFEHKGIITGTLVIWIIFMLIELKTRECSSNERIS